MSTQTKAVSQPQDLDPRFTVNEFACGCLIRSEFENGSGEKWISYCWKHKAAPEMYEALEITRAYLASTSWRGQRPSLKDALDIAQAALQKAKGESRG